MSYLYSVKSSLYAACSFISSSRLKELKDAGIVASQFDEDDAGDDIFARQAFDDEVNLQVTLTSPSLLSFLEGQREDNSSPRGNQ